jgi:hypothetical protein
MTHDPEFKPPPNSSNSGPGLDPVAGSASLIWGILAMFAWLIPPVGVLVALVGLIRSRQGWHASNRDRARLGAVLAVASLLLSGWLSAWVVVTMHDLSR